MSRAKSIDLNGEKFGQLTVLCRAESHQNRGGGARRYWRVRCACGEEYEVAQNSLRSGYSTRCRKCGSKAAGLAKRGNKNSRWKGGRYLVHGGYVMVHAPGHPNAYKSPGNKGMILEHRLVMSHKIGRPLRAGEDVHHIDGNRENNDSANLQLKFYRHGRGQVVSEMVDSYLDYIALHPPVPGSVQAGHLLEWVASALDYYKASVHQAGGVTTVASWSR